MEATLMRAARPFCGSCAPTSGASSWWISAPRNLGDRSWTCATARAGQVLLREELEAGRSFPGGRHPGRDGGGAGRDREP
jgi:hypothetical protein